MRSLLSLGMLLTLALPGQAHFIWLLPAKDADSAQMVFSDELAPDKAVPITKIAQTKVLLRGADGKTTPLKAKEATDHYLIASGVKTPLEIGAVCQYGVLAKGKADPYLLMYYARTVLGADAATTQSWSELPLEIVAAKEQPRSLRVLWRGKPAAGVDVVLTVPGVAENIDRKTDDKGVFSLEAATADGIYGVRAKFVEAKEGEIDAKKYKEVRHYSTLTWTAKKAEAAAPRSPLYFVSAQAKADAKPAPKEDPAATKLLADARAARAPWNNFQGFSADITVNEDGKQHKGKVEAQANGKVRVTLDDAALQKKVQSEIGSLVAHRLPSITPSETPCAFGDDNAHHPLGRLIRVLNDELHSSYRIRDRQIIEVNRTMGDIRFTITVLENEWNKNKQYVPRSYVVNTWDAKTGMLKSSVSHHQTWTRQGDYDLPSMVLSVRAAPEGLASRQITFENVKMTAGK